MRVQLKLVLDAHPDAVWAALRSPSVLSEVAHPFFSFEPLSPRGLPRVWTEGPHPVRASLLWGLFPVGEQVVDIRFRERGGTRIIEDARRPGLGRALGRHGLAAPDGGDRAPRATAPSTAIGSTSRRDCSRRSSGWARGRSGSGGRFS